MGEHGVFQFVAKLLLRNLPSALWKLVHSASKKARDHREVASQDAVRLFAPQGLFTAMCAATGIVFHHFRSAFLVELGVGSRLHE